MEVMGVTEAMEAMEVDTDPAVTERLAVTIITDVLIMAISTLILAPDTPFFGVEQAFGSGRPGSHRSGSAAFTGDSAPASYSCPNGKSQDGTLQVLPLATFC
jgi:hypothetical protein